MNTYEHNHLIDKDPPSVDAKLLPWLVVCGWLIGSLVAFGYFQSRVPQGIWCRTPGQLFLKHGN